MSVGDGSRARNEVKHDFPYSSLALDNLPRFTFILLHAIHDDPPNIPPQPHPARNPAHRSCPTRRSTARHRVPYDPMAFVRLLNAKDEPHAARRRGTGIIHAYAARDVRLPFLSPPSLVMLITGDDYQNDDKRSVRSPRNPDHGHAVRLPRGARRGMEPRRHARLGSGIFGASFCTPWASSKTDERREIVGRVDARVRPARNVRHQQATAKPADLDEQPLQWTRSVLVCARD